MQASVPSRLVPAQAVDEIDLGDPRRLLRRKRKTIRRLPFLAPALAFTGVTVRTPRYRSEARVLIETRDNIFLRPEADKATERNSTVDPEGVPSQVQPIPSRELAGDVIRGEKLNDLPEFDWKLGG